MNFVILLLATSIKCLAFFMLLHILIKLIKIISYHKVNLLLLLFFYIILFHLTNN